MRKKISVVIPTYNEEANVVPLSQAIIEVMEKDLSEYDYEILFIDTIQKIIQKRFFADFVQITERSRQSLMQKISDRRDHRCMG